MSPPLSARALALASMLSLAACSADAHLDGASGEVPVTPPQVTLAPADTQFFTAAVGPVAWSVQQGAAGGSITADGLYTAPSSPGTYAIVATDAQSGRTGQATVTVMSSETTITHGLAIPPTHPRLWYDAGRLAAARTWYASHPIQPDTSNPNTADVIEMATRGLLDDDSAMCRAALDWAHAQTTAIRMSGVSCDACRWYGEAIILAYDFCHAYMTPTERSAFIAATNAWIDYWREEPWGGLTMPENNYFWGYTRNELMWAITSYTENTPMAQTLLDDVFVNRLEGSFYPEAASGPMQGGIGREGTQYGIYIPGYANVPWITSWLLGRDVFTETNYWREAAYHLIYSLSPVPTTGGNPNQVTQMGFTFFPYSDDEQWLNGQQIDGYAANFMAAVAARWPNENVGRHARQWLDTTSAEVSPFVASVDAGGPARGFADLPLDYYGPGAGMVYGRTAWGPAATTFHLQLKDGPHEGHSHAHWGNWQLWRNGRYLSRESVSYGETVVGYAGAGSASADLTLGHNSLLVDGAGNRHSQWTSGRAVVTRLESRPGYTFAATDLSGISTNPSFVSWVREFVFVRPLETLVVLDRVQSASASSTKTFLAHCETSPALGTGSATCTNGSQALVMRTLVPASSTYRVVSEGGAVGQHRIEVDTAPGAAQSYILTVLQAKDASAASLSPSVVDGGASYTVTLDGSTSITFQKGMTSSGGSITAGGATTAFRAGVQPIVVTDGGPAWQ